MFTALLIVNLITLLAVVLLLLRKQPVPATDTRLTQMPEQLTRLDARNEALDGHLRSGLAEIRRDAADDARRTREAASGQTSPASALRLRRLSPS